MIFHNYQIRKETQKMKSMTRVLQALLLSVLAPGCIGGELPEKSDHTDSSVTEVPLELEDAVLQLLPEEVRQQGYVLHYQTQNRDGDLEAFKVSYGGLIATAEGALGEGLDHYISVLFDHDTRETLLCQDERCQSVTSATDILGDGLVEWRASESIDTITPKSHYMCVATFYVDANYSGSSYCLGAYVTTSGEYTYSVPNAVNIGFNDVWSSYSTYDGFCSTCTVNGWEVDPYNVTVWKDINFSGKSFNFGGDDYDSDFDNDHWGGVFYQGDIDNKVSSVRVKMSVYSSP
jgi:hypothetical protein